MHGPRARPALLALLLLAPLAAEAARIEGRIVPDGREAAGARLLVELLGVQPGGETIERSTRSDAAGRYAFVNLPESAVYLVMATHQGVRFPGGRVVFEEGSPGTQTVDVRIYEQSRDRDGVALERAEWTVERLEAGSYRIEQRALIRNPRSQVIVSDPNQAPILRIGIAPGHGELFSPFGAVPMGFEVDGETLDLRGPLLPGEREVVFGYELDGEGPELAGEIAFPDAVGEFALFVRDVGVRIEAEGLHPARPARDEAGIVYQRYLGFEIPAGRRIRLRISSLPAPRSGGGALTLALAAGGLTLALALFVFAPLARRTGPAAPASTEPSSASAAHDALYAALHELEHDYETGKLSEADRDRLRTELVREAALELERAGGAGRG